MENILVILLTQSTNTSAYGITSMQPLSIYKDTGYGTSFLSEFRDAGGKVVYRTTEKGTHLVKTTSCLEDVKNKIHTSAPRSS